MTLMRTEGLLMMLLSLIPMGFSNNIGPLLPPSRLIMESLNMRHTLSWHPQQDSCNSTVLYSVQYQGEFELLLRNGSWVDAIDCQQIPQTHCDLTFDLGSDSDYNLQVRAQCGTRISAWTKLSRPFNRRETVLMVPEMTVTTAGGVLHVSFGDFTLSATIRVTVWKKGDELQALHDTLSTEQPVMTVAALQEGAIYCVRAQITLDSGNHSGHTDPRCVSITAAGPQTDAWKKPTAVTVSVIIAGGLLCALLWSVVQCRPEVCQAYFQKEPLPQSLKGDWEAKVRLNSQGEERCDEVRIDCERMADD